MARRSDTLRDEIARRGTVLATVRGDSMSPHIDRGEVVRLAPAPRLRRGQVVAFEDEHGALLVHRVIRIRGRSVFCRGDNRHDRDRPVDRAAVVAIAVAVRRPPDGPWRPLRRSVLPSLRLPLRRQVARVRWHLRRLAERLGRSRS